MEVTNIVGHRSHYKSIGIGVSARNVQLVVQHLELLARFLFVAEHFYNLLPFRHLLHVTVERAERLLLADEIFRRFGANRLYSHNHYKQHNEHKHGKRKAVK